MTHDERQIREYLLGDLSAPASDDLEARLFLDDAFLLHVQEAEHALADDFASGDLSTDQQLRFRQLCAHSPALQHLVADSTHLQTALQRRAARKQSFRFSLSYRVLAPALTAAACLVLGFFLLHKREATKAPTVTQTTIPQAKPQQPDPAQPPTFFLAAIVTRGPAQATTLQIAPATTQINLQLELAGYAADAPNWKIDLLTPTGPTLLSADSHPRHAGPIVFLTCTLDTTHLPDGRYLVRFAPLSASESQLTREFLLKRSR